MTSKVQAVCLWRGSASGWVPNARPRGLHAPASALVEALLPAHAPLWHPLLKPGWHLYHRSNVSTQRQPCALPKPSICSEMPCVKHPAAFALPIHVSLAPRAARHRRRRQRSRSAGGRAARRNAFRPRWPSGRARIAARNPCRPADARCLATEVPRQGTCRGEAGMTENRLVCHHRTCRRPSPCLPRGRHHRPENHHQMIVKAHAETVVVRKQMPERDAQAAPRRVVARVHRHHDRHHAP